MTGIAGDGVAAVAADGEGGGDFDRAFGRVGADAGGDAVLLDEAGGFPAHAECEGGEVGGFGGEEVEEVPLRHEGDEFAVRGEVGEVGYVESDGRRRWRRAPATWECGMVRNFSSRPSSWRSSSVEGWMVSPRKSRKKSLCFSRTVTWTPARARRKPSMMPAGPPPMMQQVVASGFGAVAIGADERSKPAGWRQKDNDGSVLMRGSQSAGVSAR